LSAKATLKITTFVASDAQDGGKDKVAVATCAPNFDGQREAGEVYLGKLVAPLREHC